MEKLANAHAKASAITPLPPSGLKYLVRGGKDFIVYVRFSVSRFEQRPSIGVICSRRP
jgi:hypothetical protein